MPKAARYCGKSTVRLAPGAQSRRHARVAMGERGRPGEVDVGQALAQLAKPRPGSRAPWSEDGAPRAVWVEGAAHRAATEVAWEHLPNSIEVQEQTLLPEEVRIGELAAAGLWKGARRMLEGMWQKGLTPHAVTYAAVIGACAAAMQWGHAVRLVREMHERGIVPKLEAYHSAIAVCIRARQWEWAAHLMQELRNVGLQPTIETYRLALEALSQGQRWRQARQMLEQMQEEGIVPDTDAFNEVLRICGQQQQWTTVLRLLDEMQETQTPLDTRTFQVAVRAAASNGRWEDSVRLLDEAKQRGCALQDPMTYALAIEACEQAGDLPRAMQLVSELLEHGPQPETVGYEAAMRVCERAEQWSLLRELERHRDAAVAAAKAAASANAGIAEQSDRRRARTGAALAAPPARALPLRAAFAFRPTEILDQGL